jgi:hypothetical protein
MLVSRSSPRAAITELRSLTSMFFVALIWATRYSDMVSSSAAPRTTMTTLLA